MTTPNQDAPDGAITVGGGEWNYGQLVSEKSARSQFEVESPTDLAEAMELLPVFLNQLPNESLKPWQKFLGLPNEDLVNGNVVQGIIDSLSDSPLKGVIQNVQGVIDNIFQSVFGGSSTNNPLVSIGQSLTKAWTDFWDGLNGSSNSSGKRPEDVRVAAGGVRTAALNAGTNAGIADGKAATALSNIQTTVDGIFQSIFGGSTTGNPLSSVVSSLQKGWADFWDGLTGNTGSTSKLPSDVRTAASSVRTQANLGVTNAGLADGKATAADGKAVAAQTNVQSTVDSIFRSVFGGTSSNNPISSVITSLQKGWSEFWDGLTGNSGSTNKLPADVRVAASSVRTTANTADVTASTASSNVNLLGTNLQTQPQTVLGNIANVIVDGVANVSNFLNGLWEGLTGQSGSGKTVANVKTAAAAVNATANSGVTSAAIAAAQAASAQTTANTATTAAATADSKAVTAQNAAATADTKAIAAKSIANAGIQQGNLVSNPSFESTNFLIASGWYTTEQARTGSRSVAMNGNGNYNTWWLTSTENSNYHVPVTAGDMFDVEFWVRGKSDNTNTTGIVLIAAEVKNSAGQIIDYPLVGMTANTALNGVWTKVSGTITMPTNAVTAAFFLQVQNQVLTGTYYFDDPVVRYATANNADGKAVAAQATANTGVTNAATAQAGANVAQNAANAAQSTASSAFNNAATAQSTAASITEAFTTALKGSVNLCQNPGFEDEQAALGWQTSQLSISTSIKRSDSRSLRVRSASPNDVYFYLGSTRFGETYYKSGAGRKYFIEGWVYSDPNNVDASVSSFPVIILGIWFYNAANEYVANATAQLPSHAATRGQWVKVSAIVVAPDDASIVYARPLGVTPGWAGLGTNNFWWIDDVTIKDVTEAYDADQRAIAANAEANTAKTNAATAQSAATLADGKAVVAQTAAATADSKAVTAQTTANTASSNVTAAVARADQDLYGGSNLFTDPSFENVNYVYQPKRSSDFARTGSYSIKFVGGEAEAGTPIWGNSSNPTTWFKANPGDRFYLEMWVRAADSNTQDTGNSCGIVMWFRNAAGTYLGPGWAVLATARVAHKGTWTKFSGYITAPAGTTEMSGYAERAVEGGLASGQVYYMDDVVLREVTEGNIAKDDADAAQATANTGVTNALIAQAAANTAGGIAEGAILSGGNLIGNPSFESTQFLFSGQSTFTRSNEIARTGSWSVRCAPDAVYREFTPATTSTNSNITFKAVAGDSYYFEFWVYGRSTNSNTTSGGIYGKFVGVNAAGVYTEDGYSELLVGPTLKNKWTKVYGTYTFKNPNTTGFFLQIAHTNAIAAGDIYFIDDVVLREVSAGNLSRDMVRTGPNLVSNPGFESSNFALRRLGNSWTITNEIARSGSRCAKLGPGINSWNNIVITVDDVGDVSIPASFNDVYYIEFWIRGHQNNSNTTAGLIYVIIDMIDGAGNGLGNSNIWVPLGPSLKNTWTKVSGYAKLTASATAAIKILISNSDGIPSSDIYYVDDVIVREVTEGNIAKLDASAAATTASNAVTNAGIADGKAVAAQNTANTAKGVSNALTKNGANILANPGFESGFLNNTADADWTISTALPRTGTKSARYVSNNRWQAMNVTVDENGWVWVPATVGETYYVEFWVRGASGNSNSTTTPPGYSTGTLYVQFDCRDSNFAGTESPLVYIPTSPSLKNVWTKVSGYVKFTNQNTSMFRAYLLNSDGVIAGDVYYIDDVIIREVTEGNVAKADAGAAWTRADNAFTNAGIADGKAIETVNNIASALNGLENVSPAAVSDALAALRRTFNTLDDLYRSVQDLQAERNSAQVKGTSYNLSFSSFGNGAFPNSGAGSNSFNTIYSGAGTSLIGVQNGVAQWYSTNNANRDAKLIWQNPTNTDFQVIRGTMKEAPQQPSGGASTPKFHAMGRVNASGDTFVWARAYCDGFLSYKGEIGCTVGNTEYVWATNIPLTWSLDMRFVLGVGTNARQYQVYSGTTLVWTHTESGSASTNYSTKNSTSAVQSTLGASNRLWGALAQIRGGTGGPYHSGRVSGTSVSDNQSPAVNGSVARMYKASGTANFNGGSADNNLTTFWDTVEYESPDVDADTATGTFRVTESKPYLITGRVRFTTGVSSTSTLVLQRSTNNGSSYPEAQLGLSVANSRGIHGSWVQYLNAGDRVRLSVRHDGVNLTNVLTNGQSESYFSIAGAG